MDRPNAFSIVTEFEQAVAKFTSAPFAVAVDTCTAALFLSMRYLRDRPDQPMFVGIPKHTFLGVASAVAHAGYEFGFVHKTNWQVAGYYALAPLPVIDSATFLAKDMYPQLCEKHRHLRLRGPIKHTYACVSFQYRKPLPIGRGGMILHDDPEADKWFRLARFFGRHEVPIEQETGPEFLGWHMYMEPDRAARGLALLMHYPDQGRREHLEYPDLSQYELFKDVPRESY